jgi:hypothetical protein
VKGSLTVVSEPPIFSAAAWNASKELGPVAGTLIPLG